MGVGQHYNMAAWIGQCFGEVPVDKNWNRDKKIKPRGYVLKCIKIEDVFKKDNITFEELERLIKEDGKPASNLYSSGSIIDKNKEQEFGVDNIENYSKKIHNLDVHNKKDLDDVLYFFALQEARNIGVYYHYNFFVREIVKNKKDITVNELKEYIYYGELLDNEKFNKCFIDELNECIKYFKSDNNVSKRVIELSKKLFNEIYPQIMEHKIKKYVSCSWSILTVKDKTIGCSDLPCIDFSEKWHNYSNSKSFQEIPYEYQKAIGSCIVITLSKDKLLLGFDLLESFYFIKEIDKNNDILKDFLKKSFAFLNIYSFNCSFDYFIITGDEQKKYIFNYIVNNFQNLKDFQKKRNDSILDLSLEDKQIKDEELICKSNKKDKNFFSKIIIFLKLKFIRK